MKRDIKICIEPGTTYNFRKSSLSLLHIPASVLTIYYPHSFIAYFVGLMEKELICKTVPLHDLVALTQKQLSFKPQLYCYIIQDNSSGYF